ncbi:MAG: pimeloyl-ACP methyl ester carboxylesterase [Candidatus Poriferisodalaceae bacterium]|jgi:pimeloyl-ACP methyl ester carboxylesterase
MFVEMAGLLSAEESARVNSLRRAEQDIVLAIWAPATDLEALVASVGSNITAPYLALNGIDPGDDYEAWLRSVITAAPVSYELWADHGHYPHLVDPDRFVTRIVDFWAGVA